MYGICTEAHTVTNIVKTTLITFNQGNTIKYPSVFLLRQSFIIFLVIPFLNSISNHKTQYDNYFVDMFFLYFGLDFLKNNVFNLFNFVFSTYSPSLFISWITVFLLLFGHYQNIIIIIFLYLH